VAVASAAVALGSEPAPRGALPGSIAALGDSFTVALYSGCSPGPVCPANSWSTGTEAAVRSHLRRLRELGAHPAAQNFAVSGRKVSDLGRQVGQAVTARSEYVTILIGLNDVCRETVADMTPVAAFHSQFEGAMANLGQRPRFPTRTATGSSSVATPR
jgi:lysophospholipase L1-like esterase